MIKMTTSVSNGDYPEHLNPFYEDDNHNRIRFWTQTKRLVRSNSFSLSNFNEGFKELRNSIRRNVSRSRRSSTTVTPETSPVVLRRQLNDMTQNRSLIERKRNEHGFVIPYPEQKYQYKNSMTPTPRNKFDNCHSVNEWGTLPIRSKTQRAADAAAAAAATALVQQQQQHDEFDPHITSTPRKAASVCGDYYNRNGSIEALSGRKLSMTSLNPFDDADRISLTSTRPSTLTRKKRKAPLPPTIIHDDSGIKSIDTTINTTDPIYNTPLEINENDLSDNNINKSAESGHVNNPEIIIETCTNNDDDIQSDKLPEVVVQSEIAIEINSESQIVQSDTAAENNNVDSQNVNDLDCHVDDVEHTNIVVEQFDDNQVMNNDNVECVDVSETNNIQLDEEDNPIATNQTDINKEKSNEYVDVVKTNNICDKDNQILTDITTDNDEPKLRYIDETEKTEDFKSVKDIIRDLNRQSLEPINSTRSYRHKHSFTYQPRILNGDHEVNNETPTKTYLATEEVFTDDDAQSATTLESTNCNNNNVKPIPVPRRNKHVEQTDKPKSSKRNKFLSKLTKWVKK